MVVLASPVIIVGEATAVCVGGRFLVEGDPVIAGGVARQDGLTIAQQVSLDSGCSPTDKVSERVAAATEELASGLTQASAAAEELRRSMEQIASGADEAAGAAQEQLAAIKTVVGNLGIARGEAEAARRRTEAVQLVLAETAAQVTTGLNC